MTKFKIGQVVTHATLGIGMVRNLNKEPYPVQVRFKGNRFDTWFTAEGRLYASDKKPSLEIYMPVAAMSKFQVGTKVVSKRFGKGTITSLVDDKDSTYKYKVLFNNARRAHYDADGYCSCSRAIVGRGGVDLSLDESYVKSPLERHFYAADRVFSLKYGWGIISAVNTRGSHKSVFVNFLEKDCAPMWYTHDGWLLANILAEKDLFCVEDAMALRFHDLVKFFPTDTSVYHNTLGHGIVSANNSGFKGYPIVVKFDRGQLEAFSSTGVPAGMQAGFLMTEAEAILCGFMTNKPKSDKQRIHLDTVIYLLWDRQEAKIVMSKQESDAMDKRYQHLDTIKINREYVLEGVKRAS